MTFLKTKLYLLHFMKGVGVIVYRVISTESSMTEASPEEVECNNSLKYCIQVRFCGTLMILEYFNFLLLYTSSIFQRGILYFLLHCTFSDYIT